MYMSTVSRSSGVVPIGSFFTGVPCISDRGQRGRRRPEKKAPDVVGSAWMHDRDALAVKDLDCVTRNDDRGVPAPRNEHGRRSGEETVSRQMPSM
jgi:hypothetical protein